MKKTTHIFCFVFLLLLFFGNKTSAQLKPFVEYHFAGNDSAIIVKQFPLPKNYSTAVVFKSDIENWLLNVRSLGYLTANMDSMILYPTKLKVMIFLGEKFLWSDIKWSRKNIEWVQQTGINIGDYKGKTVMMKKWFQTAEQVLRYAENNGYPFCELKLDSVQVLDKSITAVIVLDKHLKVSIDSIHFQYTNVVNKNFLYHYLGIKPGMVYSEAVIQKINSLLSGLSFLKQQQSYSITFIGEHAVINFFLQPQSSSRFNFLLGLQPSNTVPTPTNPVVTTKFLLSGEGDLHLENMMQTANTLDMSFKLYPQQTKDLTMQYLHPFFLNTPFGVDGKFEIYKHDSTYTDIDFNGGIRHMFSANNYVKVFYSTHSSSLDYIDTTTIKATHQLPSIVDYKYKTIGVELNKEQLDFRFNPSKGYAIKLTVLAGYKQFESNNQITQLSDPANPSFSFSSLYDSITKPILHSHVDFSFANYQRLYKRNVLKLQLKGGGSPDKKIYTNELTRIGGNASLRGFDEQSILTSFYSIFTTEYRYLLDATSYAYAFSDVAYTEVKSVALRQFDTPYGFGVGIAFGTKAGIFQLSYALGSRLGNPILIKTGKIHFGLAMKF